MSDRTEERVEESFVPRPLTEHMGWLMSRTSHALGAALMQGLGPLGLNLRSYTVLIAAERAAVEERPRTQLALAQSAGLDKSTMVVVLDALEEKGLVERLPNPGDRRARIVAVTSSGRELLARAEGVVLCVEREVLSGVEDEERELLRGLLGRVVSSAGFSESPASGSCL